MNQDTLNQTIRALNETIAKSQYLLEKLTAMRSELVIEPTEQERALAVLDFQLIENEGCYGYQTLPSKTEQETSIPTIKESLTVESYPQDYPPGRNINMIQESLTAESTPTPQELFPDIVTADLETVKRKCRYIIDTYGREQHRQPLLDLVKYHAEEKSLTKATPEELQRIYDDVCKYEYLQEK